MIELLTVIAILGLLAALLLPTLAQAKRKAQQVQCAVNLHQLSLGLNGYVTDNQSYPLYGPWIADLYREGLGIDYTKGVWRCPSARWYMDKLPQGLVPHCYSYNGYGLSAYGQANTLGLGGQNFNGFSGPPTHESDIVKPDDMMAMGDAFVPGNLFVRENLDRVELYGNGWGRHQGKAEVIFCDGHVESPKLAFLDNDTGDMALVRWNRDHQPHRERLAP